MNTNLILSLLQDGFFAAIAAIGFAVISNPPKKAVLVSALLAAVGHAVRYYLLNVLNFDLTSASIFAAFSIGMLSIFFAKKIYCPAEVFAFPALLPMIPGMFAYKTILSLLKFLQSHEGALRETYLSDTFFNGFTALFAIIALVVGVAIPLFLFHTQSFMMTRMSRVRTQNNILNQS